MCKIKVTVVSIVLGVLETVFKRSQRSQEEFGIKGRIRLSIVEIDQNTQTSLGDLKRFAIVQIPAGDHMCKDCDIEHHYKNTKKN